MTSRYQQMGCNQLLGVPSTLHLFLNAETFQRGKNGIKRVYEVPFNGCGCKLDTVLAFTKRSSALGSPAADCSPFC